MLEESPPDGRVAEAAVQRLLRQGGESLLRVVTRTYLDRWQERVGALVAAIAIGDQPEVRRLAHSQRSSSEMIGVVELGRLFGDLEQEATSGTCSGARRAADALSDLEAALGEVRPWIESWTGR